MTIAITQRLQFDIPYDIYLRLKRHPDFPGWRGRNKFFCQMLIDYVNSPAFRLREMEEAIRRVERERDQKAKEAEQNARAAEYWRERAEKAPEQGKGAEPPPWWALFVKKPTKPDEAA